MDKEDLKELIKTGEGQTLEFKETSNGVKKEIVAFANAIGGKILVGVDDSGNLKGLSNPDHHRTKVRQWSQNFNPPIKIEIEEVANVLVVDVPESNRPHSSSGTFYRRKGRDSQKLGQREIRDLLQAKGELEWDEIVNDRFRYPEDFDQEEFDQFVEDANISNTIPQKNLLRNIRAAKFDEDGEIKITNTGILFFAKNPKTFLPQAEIQCTHWESEEKDSIIDRKKISEPMISAIDLALDFIEDNIGMRTVVRGRRREKIPQVPEPVFREALVNAVMHRDYDARNQNVKVNIYPSKIIIRNPGGLLPGMTRKDLGKRSVWRNPTVADLLDRVGFVERSGTGIKRIRNRLEENNFPSPKIETNGHFEISISRKRKPTHDLSDADLSERQKNLLNYAYREGRITRSKGVEIVDRDLSGEVIYQDLKDMVEKGFLEKKGSYRNSHYVPKESES